MKSFTEELERSGKSSEDAVPTRKRGLVLVTSYQMRNTRLYPLHPSRRQLIKELGGHIHGHGHAQTNWEDEDLSASARQMAVSMPISSSLMFFCSA